MANTLSLMTNVIRNAVSKQRIRYTENGFNLDLAYICENIIAMGYPADNYESIYRNRIDDVYQFFEEHHKDHYKIYNLCSERSYDVNKFHGRVGVYPFDDHNPPTIELIQKFCNDVDRWLIDKKNVAAVHCKAGKGRTGTMICCYLLHSGFTTTAEDALAYYDEKRTKDRKGVTIPSQRRYVEYYSRLLRSGKPYERKTLQICEIKFSSPLQIHSQGTVHCSISSLPDPSSTEKAQTIHTSVIDFRKSQSIELKDFCILLTGDVKIEVYHKVMRKKEKYFHFWFNTYFVCEEAECNGDGDDVKFVHEFQKHELDDAHKDKEHKNFPEDFKVHIILKPVPRGYLNESETSQSNHFLLHNQMQNHKNHDQHNNQLPNHLLKDTINSQTVNKGPIFEATGGTLPTPTILPENNKTQNHQHQELQHHHNSDSKQNQQNPYKNHHNNTRRNYIDVSGNDQHLRHNAHLPQMRDKPSNVHNHHTPSVSPDVSRTNSSSSSSISSEASSAAGEDWESGEFKPKGTIMMMTDGRKKQNFSNSSSFSDDLLLSDIRLNNNNNLSSSVGSNKIVNASNSSSSTTNSKLISIAVRPATQKFKAKTSNINKMTGHHKTNSRKGFKRFHFLSNIKSDPDLCETLLKPISFQSKQASGLLLTGQQRNNSGTDHDDYYSSLCDRQLSFGTSPCKSPQYVNLLSSADPSCRRGKKCDIQTESNDVVVAKPIESHSIGFNVLNNKSNPMSDVVLVKKSDSYDQVNIASEKQTTAVKTRVITNSKNIQNPVQTILNLNNEQKDNCDKIQSIMGLSTIASASSPARFGNRCAPFSFRGIRRELQSVIKQSTNKTKSSCSNNCTTSNSSNRFSLNNKKKSSLPESSSSRSSIEGDNSIVQSNQKS